jgi:hypothetical protein
MPREFNEVDYNARRLAPVLRAAMNEVDRYELNPSYFRALDASTVFQRVGATFDNIPDGTRVVPTQATLQHSRGYELARENLQDVINDAGGAANPVVIEARRLVGSQRAENEQRRDNYRQFGQRLTDSELMSNYERIPTPTSPNVTDPALLQVAVPAINPREELHRLHRARDLASAYETRDEIAPIAAQERATTGQPGGYYTNREREQVRIIEELEDTVLRNGSIQDEIRRATPSRAQKIGQRFMNFFRHLKFLTDEEMLERQVQEEAQTATNVTPQPQSQGQDAAPARQEALGDTLSADAVQDAPDAQIQDQEEVLPEDQVPSVEAQPVEVSPAQNVHVSEPAAGQEGVENDAETNVASPAVSPAVNTSLPVPVDAVPEELPAEAQPGPQEALPVHVAPAPAAVELAVPEPAGPEARDDAPAEALAVPKATDWQGFGQEVRQLGHDIQDPGSRDLRYPEGIKSIDGKGAKAFRARLRRAHHRADENIQELPSTEERMLARGQSLDARLFQDEDPRDSDARREAFEARQADFRAVLRVGERDMTPAILDDAARTLVSDGERLKGRIDALHDQVFGPPERRDARLRNLMFKDQVIREAQEEAELLQEQLEVLHARESVLLEEAERIGYHVELFDTQVTKTAGRADYAYTPSVREFAGVGKLDMLKRAKRVLEAQDRGITPDIANEAQKNALARPASERTFTVAERDYYIRHKERLEEFKKTERDQDLEAKKLTEDFMRESPDGYLSDQQMQVLVEVRDKAREAGREIERLEADTLISQMTPKDVEAMEAQIHRASVAATFAPDRSLNVKLPPPRMTPEEVHDMLHTPEGTMRFDMLAPTAQQHFLASLASESPLAQVDEGIGHLDAPEPAPVSEEDRRDAIQVARERLRDAIPQINARYEAQLAPLREQFDALAPGEKIAISRHLDDVREGEPGRGKWSYNAPFSSSQLNLYRNRQVNDTSMQQYNAFRGTLQSPILEMYDLHAQRHAEIADLARAAGDPHYDRWRPSPVKLKPIERREPLEVRRRIAEETFAEGGIQGLERQMTQINDGIRRIEQGRDLRIRNIQGEQNKVIDRFLNGDREAVEAVKARLSSGNIRRFSPAELNMIPRAVNTELVDALLGRVPESAPASATNPVANARRDVLIRIRGELERAPRFLEFFGGLNQDEKIAFLVQKHALDSESNMAEFAETSRTNIEAQRQSLAVLQDVHQEHQPAPIPPAPPSFWQRVRSWFSSAPEPQAVVPASAPAPVAPVSPIRDMYAPSDASPALVLPAAGEKSPAAEIAPVARSGVEQYDMQFIGPFFDPRGKTELEVGARLGYLYEQRQRIRQDFNERSTPFTVHYLKRQEGNPLQRLNQETRQIEKRLSDQQGMSREEIRALTDRQRQINLEVQDFLRPFEEEYTRLQAIEERELEGLEIEYRNLRAIHDDLRAGRPVRDLDPRYENALVAEVHRRAHDATAPSAFAQVHAGGDAMSAGADQGDVHTPDTVDAEFVEGVDPAIHALRSQQQVDTDEAVVAAGQGSA